MKISCCLICTNLSNRYQLLNDTIKSLKNGDNIFDEKIMSIDTFDGVDLKWFNQYKTDWKINYKKKDSYKSMILNQQNVLNQAQNDVVFYSEDDIVINQYPHLDTIDKLFNSKLVNNKPIGFISYNNHVWIDFNQNPKHIIDFMGLSNLFLCYQI
jgi:hypothetical protein